MIIFMSFTVQLLLLFIFLPSSNEFRLLFANRRDIRLLESNASISFPRGGANISIVIDKLSDVTSLDWVGSTVCWTDLEDGAIYCETDSKRRTVVNNHLPSPEDMAIDWLTNKIYWTDSDNNRIEVVSIDAPYYRAVIVQEDMDQPRAIIVAPQAGLLFWTDWGEYPRIERATMSGSDRRAIITSELFWPNGIALDVEKKIVYWVDAKLHTISFSDFDGRSRGKVGKETTGHPFALIFANGGFYWSDWHTNSLHYLRNTVLPPRPVTLAPRYPLTPMDLVDYTPRPVIPSPCAKSSCSHLCLLTPASYTCVCPTGIGRLNQTHCKTEMEEFLLVARSTEMRLISLDTSDYTDLVLPFKGLRHVLAVDWEDSGWVYWTDDEKRVIERARLNGSDQKPVITTQIIHPDGLAIDPIASNLYWTDAGTDRIEVCKLDGSFRRVIISKHLQEPRAIAVDPVSGFLFWSDWGKQPKIEKSRLDGSERDTIVSDGISWPNGIALDPGSKLMYWCDGKLDKIEVCSYDGKERHVLTSSNLPHTFGFTILNNDLYWTDWQRRVIEKADKDTGRNRVTLKDPFSDANGLKAVHRWRWKGVTNGCSNGNGGCGELCFWMGDSVKCGCRSGYELEWNNRTCFLPESFLIYTGVGDLHRVSLNRSEDEEVIPVGRLKAPVAVASWGNWIYWTDSKTRTLSRAKVDGTGVTQNLLSVGLFHPEGLAIDHVGGNIYWTDMGSGKVEVCTLDGKYRRTVVWSVEEPRSIVVDQIKRYLYFSVWATTTPPGIIRSEMDGTGMISFVSNYRTHGLTIDNGYLYFTNIDSETILRKPLEGVGGLEFLFKALSPYSLIVHGERIYFSSLSNGSISHIPKTSVIGHSPPLPTPLLTFAGNVLDMTVYTTNRTNEPNVCSCEVGLCMLLRDNSQCLCGNHYNVFHSSCVGPQEFLLAATSSSVLRILNETAPDDVLANFKNARSVEWGKGLIYYDGGKLKGVDAGIEGWEIAIDQNRNWSFYCTVDGGVNVSTSAGISGIVVPGSVNPPHSLVLHPASSTLFYIQDEVVYRIRYDGRQKRKIVEGVVSGLAVNMEHLYFSIGQVVWRSALDGSARVVVVACGEEVRTIALWGEIIFYSTQSGLFKVPTAFSSTITPVLPSPVSSLKFVNLSASSTDPCASSSCGFCVEGICSCPIPLVLSPNGRHCVAKLMCGAGEWECESGAIGCIGNMKRCNGVIDCRDYGSDEANCATDAPPCLVNCGGNSAQDTSSAPWGVAIACILSVIFVAIAAYICHRRRLRKRPRIPATVTTEPLFHHPPPSHPSSSPYCELLAPHPSPATDCCRDYCGNPPPTPCSTDLCSEIVYSPPPPSSVGGTSSSEGRSRGVSSINLKRSGWSNGERYNYVPPPPSPS